MPSEKILEQKKQLVVELAERLNSVCAGVLVDYKGINVADDTQLRRELREANVDYSVLKNSLLKRALELTTLQELDGVLTGTTALAVSRDDHVAAARILGKFADKHKNFTLKSGFLDGKVISIDMLNRLAKLPSREILLATVCNVFNAPISAFARAIQAIVDKSAAAPVTEEAVPTEEVILAEGTPAVIAEAATAEAAAPAKKAAPAEEAAPVEEAAPAEETAPEA